MAESVEVVMGSIKRRVSNDPEKLLSLLLKDLGDEEENYQWGGGENADGGLEPGYVDFEKLKKRVRSIQECVLRQRLRSEIKLGNLEMGK